MLSNKKSKVKRMRGTSSHGWGHKKKHRGKGHRGGIGLSGSGARGDAKKPSILTTIGKSYFGKKGFKSLNKKSNKVLSIRFLEENFDKLVENDMIVKEKNDYIFDSTVFGYDKILGKSVFSRKMTLICNDISDGAKEIIEAAGGKVVISGEESSSEE